MPVPIKRIACVNFGGIGDEILFSPVLAAIRDHFPEAEITLLLEDRSQSVADLLPGVDRTIPLPIQKQSRRATFLQLLSHLRAGKFDAAISSGSSPFIALLLFLSGIPVRVGFDSGPASRWLLTGAAPLHRHLYAGDMYFSLARTFLKVMQKAASLPDHAFPTLNAPSAEDMQWASNIMPDTGRPKVLIHPGVSLISVRKNFLKGWPPAYWASLIEQLDPQADVYLVGGPDDADTVAAILSELERVRHSRESGNDGEGMERRFHNLYGQTRNLQQLAALIQRADVLVGVDSSPMHLAVGLHKPVAAMFGPTDEKKLLPDHPDYRAVVQPDLACRPCLWDRRRESCENPVCLDVPVERMHAAITGLLAR